MQIKILKGVQSIIGDEQCIVIIDVYLASSTIVTLFEKGAQCILPVETIDEALSLKNNDRILIGEDSNQKVPSGFDYLNSPGNILNYDFSGKTIIFRSNNLTRALTRCCVNSKVFIACFLNLSSVVRKLKQLSAENLINIVAVGRISEPGPEDELCAELLKNELLGIPYKYSEIKPLITSSPITSIVQRMCPSDIEYCARLNISTIVPEMVQEGKHKVIYPA